VGGVGWGGEEWGKWDGGGAGGEEERGVGGDGLEECWGWSKRV